MRTHTHTHVDRPAVRFRGLCSVFRSRAGDPDLLKEVVGGGGGGDDDPGNPVLDSSRLVSGDSRRHNHNIHWLEDELGETCDGPSRCVAYYDAASLYPSSGTSQYLRGGNLLAWARTAQNPSPTTPPSGGGGRARKWVGLFAVATYRADNIFPFSLCHTQPKQSRSSSFLQSSTTFPTDRAAVFTWLLQAAEERKTRPTIGDYDVEKSRRKQKRRRWTLFKS